MSSKYKYIGLFCSSQLLSLSTLIIGAPSRRICQIIDGKAISKSLLARAKELVTEWRNHNRNTSGRAPKFAVILAGDDASSSSYVRVKLKAAKYVGISAEVINLPVETQQTDLIGVIQRLNNDVLVDGILVQLPLYPHMNERIVCNSIHPDKDIDGFTATNIGKLCLGDPSAFGSCTALAVHHIITHLGLPTAGKHAVVIGRSKHVGLPVSLLLHSSDNQLSFKGLEMTTTICHRHTPKEYLEKLCLSADLIVSAAGVPGLITAEMVKYGTVVLDVGFTAVKSDKSGKHIFLGDVDFKSVKEKASFLSSVPGGVGPVTVAMLMFNILKAAQSGISDRDFHTAGQKLS